MKHVVCLFEHSGLSADEWANNGYSVFCYDILHTHHHVEGNKHFVPWDALDVVQNAEIVKRHKGNTAMVLAFPPCTDLAVSGTRHFATKRAANPGFQNDAMHLVFVALTFGLELAAPYCIENPVGVISSMWRKPDYIFHPFEYGLYLPVNDIHPKWPEYIMPRDAYPKKTCYWTGNGFVMPPKLPVAIAQGYSKQYKKLGGKSAKTKEIRNTSPRGVNIAIYLANRSK